ncbi:MAG: branched-chain amino acid ABC transporter ATP-binding protein/permease [Firmicutes bacterium]|mgnify:CR=1 FL=1|nr:branched-chain amino acid ABC transporter ATP-binding protein/permease [Bacillota bacterium]
MGQDAKKAPWIVLFAALLVVPLLISSPYFQDIVFLVYMQAILSVAWNIAGGFAGVFSIGHSIFFGVSAYTISLMSKHYGIPPLIGVIIGIVLVIAVCQTLGRLLLRLQDMFFTLATSAALLIFYHSTPYFRNITGGWSGVSLGRELGIINLAFDNPVWYSIIGAMVLIAVTLLSIWIKNSKTGYYFMALREDEAAASASGVNVQAYKIRALTISAIITAIASAIATGHIRQVSPDFAFSALRSIEMFLFTIVGGIGTVAGPLIGAFLLTPISEFLRVQFGGRIAGLNQLIFGVVLIIIILRLPEGLVSLAWHRRRAAKHNKYVKAENAKINASCENPAYKVQDEVLEKVLKESNMEVQNPDDDCRIEVTQPKSPVQEKADKLLCVAGISKKFGGLQALYDVTFDVYNGEILGIIGPNGAGKSTLFNVINGFIKPDSGTIKFLGSPITGKGPHKVFEAGIGRIFQHLKPLRNMTIVDNVKVGAFGLTSDRFKAGRLAKEALERVGFSPNRYNLLPGQINVLEQKQLELARVLAGDPKLILVDEIMAGLKPEEIDEVVEILRGLSSQGITLAIIEHRMRAVMKLSNRIMVLHHGRKLCEGTPADVVADDDVVEAYLGVTLEESQKAAWGSDN